MKFMLTNNVGADGERVEGREARLKRQSFYNFFVRRARALAHMGNVCRESLVHAPADYQDNLSVTVSIIEQICERDAQLGPGDTQPKRHSINSRYKQARMAHTPTRYQW